MKFSPVLALFTVCAPIAVPVVAHAQMAASPEPLIPLPLAPQSAATSDAFVWRFAPPVGSRWTMRSFMRASSLTDVPAMDGEKAQQIKFNSIQKFVADYDILKRDELGATTVRLTMREMTTDVNSVVNGEMMPAPAREISDPTAVRGATLTIKQAPDGAVWGVVGMRAFQRKLLQASGSLDAATITRILDASPMTSDSSMIKSLSMAAGTLPTSPVRVGESWNYKIALPAQMPFALDISGTRTLKSLDSDIAVVSDSARLDGGNDVQKMPAMPGTDKLDVDYSQLTGTVAGTSRVQRSSGLPLESTVNLTLRGSISTQIPANAGAPARKLTVPLDVTTATRIVLEPR